MGVKTWTKKTGPGSKSRSVRRKYQTETTHYKNGKVTGIDHTHHKTGKTHSHKVGRGLLGGIFAGKKK